MLLDFNFKEFVWSLHSQPSSLQIEQKFQLSDANNSSWKKKKKKKKKKMNNKLQLFDL